MFVLHASKIKLPKRVFKNDEYFKELVEAIRKNNLKVPIVVDQNNRIVDGLLRYKACLLLRITEIICVRCQYSI